MHVSTTGVPIPSHTANQLYDAQEQTKRDATLASTRNQLLVVWLNRFCSTSCSLGAARVSAPPSASFCLP